MRSKTDKPALLTARTRSPTRLRVGMDPTKLAELRRQRHEPTPAEQILWEQLRRRRLSVRFRNRHLIAGFMVDFYAPSVRLAIEVDGPIHDAQRDHDEARTMCLHALGVSVVRVRNDDVLHD